MKSAYKKAEQQMEREMNKKGQLEIGNNLVKGVLAIIFLIVFYFVFVGQLFTAVPLPAGSIEANNSDVVRRNGSAAMIALSGNFTNWMTLGAFVIIIILLIVAYRYYNAGAGAAGSQGKGY